MKKLLTAIGFYLWAAGSAFAGVSCTLPFTLQNNTLADATQVMANYTALVTCLTNAAAAGANSDITSLNGLTTPLSATQGGTPVYIASTTSTGAANAQIVPATTPANFSLTKGFKVIFQAGFTNTGPTTFQVAGTAATNVFRTTTDGIQALVGGEIIANSIVEAIFDGTQYELMSNVIPFPVGTVLDTIAAAADVGFVLLQGQCVSTTTLAALWTKMGSPGVGICAAGQFALPDGRGRVVAMIDSGGSGRISVIGGNFDGTVLFNSGGNQNLLRSALPNTTVNYTPSGTITNTFTNSSTNEVGVTGTLSGSGTFVAGTTASGTVGITLSSVFNGTANLQTTSINGNVTQTGSLPPTLMLNKQVKY